MSNHDDNKGIIIMGANCLIRMINDSACRILGYAAKVRFKAEGWWVHVQQPIFTPQMFMCRSH
jgi:hypothetical protein